MRDGKLTEEEIARAKWVFGTRLGGGLGGVDWPHNMGDRRATVAQQRRLIEWAWIRQLREGNRVNDCCVHWLKRDIDVPCAHLFTESAPGKRGGWREHSISFTWEGKPAVMRSAPHHLLGHELAELAGLDADPDLTVYVTSTWYGSRAIGVEVWNTKRMPKMRLVAAIREQEAA